MQKENTYPHLVKAREICQRNRRDPDKIKARFWSKVKIGGEDDCWVWIGATRGDGYGNVRIMKKTKLAHRVAYEFTYGPIPDGLLVCHDCDTPACCNPSHGFLGTHLDNRNDCVSKRRNVRHKLTEEAVKIMRELWNAGVHSAAQLGVLFDVRTETASAIVHRRLWKHVK